MSKREVIADYKSFSIDKFKKHLESVNIETISAIHESLKDQSNIFIHAHEKRKNRSAFLDDLSDFLKSKNLADLSEYVYNKKAVIEYSEQLFDKISNILNECDISRLDIEKQCWAYIKRYELQLDDVKKRVEEKYKEAQKRKTVTTLPSLTIEEGDHSFSPDVAIEKLTTALTTTFKMLAHSNKWYDEDFIVIPAEVAVSEKDMFKAGSTEIFSISWKELENCSSQSLLFGGKALHKEGENVPQDAREKGKVKSSYHFEREESDYEIIDSISNQRLLDKLSQNFLEVALETDVSDLIVDSLDDIKSIDDKLYVCHDEAPTLVSLSDILCTNVKSDTTEYDGLRIVEWVRGYSCLKYIYEKNIQSKGIILNDKELKNYFVNAGLSEEKAEIFKKSITFNRQSKDFYDCPALKLSNGDYYLFTQLCGSFVTINVVMSQLSTLKVNIKNKGKDFENATIKNIQKAGITCKSFKFNRNNEDFEYDAVFSLDNKIFVIECKNTGLSLGNVNIAHRKKKYYSDAADQVKRLVKALHDFPEIIEEQLAVKIENFEIVPVILNCLPFSWVGKFNGVYITDSSAFFKILKKKEINFALKQKGKEDKDKVVAHKLWKSNKLSADDLINQFEEPIQVVSLMNHRIARGMWYPASNDSAFTVVHFETDHEARHKEAVKLWKRELKKIKGNNSNSAKKRKNKRQATKKSRRANRRK